ncbi:hypothetical protein HDV01_002030 [Terramyces sp. JEL0728]|nr:hypothetical protein HDV01_002030 [Terramyces sp. JEL0728]
MNSKILLVFDLNGTIITRLNSKEYKELKNIIKRNPDFSSNKMKVFIRPHWNQFLETLMNAPQYSVAVWTSAQPKNAVALTEKIFGKHTNQLEFILDRSHCEDAPMGIKVDTAVKNLDTNTLLIDDTRSKAKKQPDNLLEIPTFDVAVADVDNYLPVLEKWLLNVELGDARQMVKNPPFKLISDQQ